MSRKTALIALLCVFVTGAGAQAPTVTRAEVIVFLFHMSQKSMPTVGSTEPVFSDVAAGSLQERALKAAVECDMIDVNPITNAVYPDASVSRGEYLRMLATLFSLPTDTDFSYTDIPSYASYAPYVWLAERCHLFAVEKDDELKPEEPILINEAAGAVYALLQCSLPSLSQTTSTVVAPVARPTVTTHVAMQISSSSLRTLVQRMNSVLTPPLILLPNATEQKKLQIIGLANQERLAAGLLPLVRNAQLEQAAQAHAKDMYKRGYFSHFNPEGQNYIDRIRATQYLTLPAELCPCQAIFNLSELFEQRSEVSQHYLVTKRAPVCNCNPRFALGENIARGQQTAPIAVEQWMASTSHRQTILQPLFRETGVGVFGDVWVQEFGSLSLE